MGDPAATAARLIGKNGRTDGVLRRPGNDQLVQGDRPWAPQDADPIGDSPIAAGLGVVILDQSVLNAQQSQALHPESTAMGLLPGSAVEPLIGDLLETKGERYMVLRVDKLAPAGKSILFTLSLKAR